jgi:hypothetical protein
LRAGSLTAASEGAPFPSQKLHIKVEDNDKRGPMKSNERSCKFFDLILEVSGRTRDSGQVMLPSRPLLDVLRVVEKLHKSAGALRENRARTETYYLADVDIDEPNGKAVLLLNRSDRLGADQAISAPKTKGHRIASKTANEGNDFSAHLTLKLNHQKGAKNVYLALLEDTPGLSSGNAAFLLNFVFRECARAYPAFFEYAHPDGSVDPKTNKRRRIKGRYTASLRGHPSENFIKELNAGALEGIEIIDTHNSQNVWDDEKRTLEQSTVVNLRPKAIAGQTWYQVLQSVCRTAQRKNMQEARIKFTDASNFGRTITIDTATLQLANEDRFVRRERLVNFAARLPTSFKLIQTEIRDKMYIFLK